MFHTHKPCRVLLLAIWQPNYPNNPFLLKIIKKVENQRLFQSTDELARNQGIHKAEYKGTWKQREITESAPCLGNLPTLMTLSSGAHGFMEPRRWRHSTGQPKWHIPEDPRFPKLGRLKITPSASA